MATNNNVFFVCVARLADRVIVARHNYNSNTDLQSVKTVLRQNMNIAPGTVYSFEVSETTWHLIGDDAGRIYVLIAANAYPMRFAMQCLDEFQRIFVSKVGDASLRANENGLTSKCNKMLAALCAKYDNVHELDEVAALQSKVRNVQLTMQENVRVALEGTTKVKQLEESAEELQAQAGVFKRQAHDLRKHMWWKNCKLKLIIAFIVLAIIGVIATVIAVQTKGSDK